MPPNPPHEDARSLTPYDGGTRQLLKWGSSMVGAGLLCAVLLVTLMCLPFGGLLLILGIAKWLRNSREQGSK
jgi:hypothetical protein